MCNRIVLMTAILVISVFNNINGQNQNQAQLDYIELYKDIAIREMERASIPASITLAQGLIESGAGSSWLAVEGNNHFGIKCGSDWYGQTVYKKDDERNDAGNLILSCFRKYDSAEESFVAHSDFLHHPNKPWYKPLFDLEITDYHGWAHGLKDAGYATNPNYPQLLINIIERYNLNQYDTGIPAAPVVETDDDYLFINGLPYTLATEGETVASVAYRKGVSAKKLVKYNDGLLNGNQRLQGGQIIFLKQKKWNNTEELNPFHTVAFGETMLDLSQKYGVTLFWLYFKNRMKEGMEPAIGSRIKLRGSRVKVRPKLTTEASQEPVVAGNNEDYIDWQEPPSNPVRPVIVELPSRDAEPEISPTETAYNYYTVKKGDTLWRISQKYKLTVDELKTMNNLTDNIINSGQKLRVGKKN